MKLDDDTDFTTLSWVKDELDQTLSRARQSLEVYVEAPADTGAMRECANCLHMVHGTLRMVELYGAAMVVQDMEHLTGALLEDTVADRDEAYSALMRGLVQMPDYLDRLHSGHRDIPIVLLPLLNELRASRGEELLHESSLFTPNLEASLPADAPGAQPALTADEQKRRVAILRAQFQQQLLTWFRGQGGPASLAGMRDAMDALAACCHTLAARRLWWITAGVLDGLRSGALEAHGAEVKQLIGRVDRYIKALIGHGEPVLVDPDVEELIRRLLYYVAMGGEGSDRLDELRHTYRLDGLLAQDQEVEHARSAMAGHNRALLDTVSQAIKEDLLRVKDGLDMFLRKRERTPAELMPQAEVLNRVADTLGMLGLSVPRRVVNEQQRLVQDLADRNDIPDDDLLLDVAGALLYVEASLDDHIERLGAEASGGDESMRSLPRSEARQVLEACMREAVGNLARVKEAVVAFIESPWEHAHLHDAPHLLEEISGALGMLNEQRPAELLSGVSRFIHNELVVDQRIPTVEQMDKLADALASAEYYLEAAREHRGGLSHILDVTEGSLRGLGYWPMPARREAELAADAETDVSASEHAPVANAGEDSSDHPGTDETADSRDAAETPDSIGSDGAADTQPSEPDLDGLTLAETVPDSGAEDADEGWIEVEDNVREMVPVPDDMALNAGFQGTADEIDQDIREVFLEEVQDEIDALRRSLEAWDAGSDAIEQLAPVRRSFHTLKGSGRLVGAETLGELSWHVENMLNRALDGTIEPHAGVRALVEHAVVALPQLLSALDHGSVPDAPLMAIVEAADKLAEGHSDARVEDFADRRTQAVQRKVKRRVRADDVDAIPQSTLAAMRAEDEGAPGGNGGADGTQEQESPALADPVLLEILGSEIEMHLNTIRAHMDAADASGMIIEEPVLRAVHTLNGAIAMVEVPVLAQVLTPLESYVKRLCAARDPVPGEGLQALRDSVDLIEQVAAQLDAERPLMPDSDALAARLCELRDGLPEPNLAHVLYGSVPEDDGEADAIPADIEGTSGDEAGAPADATEDMDAATPADEMPADKSGAEFAADFGEREAAQSFLDDDVTSDSVDGDEEGATADTAPMPDGHVVDEATEADEADEASGAAGTAAAPADQDVAKEGDPSGADAEKEVDAETAGGSDSTRVAESAAHAGLEAGREPESDGAGTVDSDDHGAAMRHAIDDVPESANAPDDEPADLADDADSVELIDDEVTPISQETTADTESESESESASEPALGPLPADFAFPDDAQPEGALDMPDVDEDLLEVFVEEARDILDHADGVMAHLREAPDNRAHLSDLQRDLHTFKGGARIAGFGGLGDTAHAMETLLDVLSAGRMEVDATVVESLERGFDLLHALVQRVVNRQAIATPARAIQYLEALAGGSVERTASEAALSAPDAEVADTAASDDAATASVAAVEPAERTPRPALLPEEPEGQPAPQELIRVRADLLDSLVNYAGEVSIYRSRLEQQVSGFRFNIAEFEQTVKRLREQLRMLEIETEAQIIARYQHEQRETGDMTVFDPLEMDRFSQLQQYSRALAESVADLVSLQTMLDDNTRQSETLLLQQSRVNSDLQEGLMRTRMVPFDSMVPSLRRTVRQAAQEVDKRAQIKVRGAHGEMDRNLLERMKAPFEHMLRNALAHGIESPQERREAGKDEEGLIRIEVGRDATEVVIRISDDGAGIDRDAIRQKAIERGLLRQDAHLSDRDLFGFILESGFSTAQSVTQLSGRGVGMDVVANEIKQMGGTLAIESEHGEGTTFVIRVPFTLAVTQAILVKNGDATFAIPMTSVQGVARVGKEDLAERLHSDNPSVTYGGEDYAIYDLAALIGVPASQINDESQPPLLLTRSGDLRAAVRIDQVLGSREIVVKSVGPQVSSVPGIFGATIMGDGSVVMILDLAPLVRHGAARMAPADLEAEDAPETPEARREDDAAQPLVMVVDDSITMRKVSSRILERHGYEVVTAKDGMDAVEKLQERIPDLMLLDIEMPRMDGYELATYMKNDSRLKDVPIIMITSRTGGKHRQRALDIGVNAYLGKPYQEHDLVAHIQDFLSAPAN